jgi:hypothetical protein
MKNVEFDALFFGKLADSNVSPELINLVFIVSEEGTRAEITENRHETGREGFSGRVGDGIQGNVEVGQRTL